MNAPQQNIVSFRCQYPGCDSKVFTGVDTKGIFRNVNGTVIWDLTSQVSIIYSETCAYHAFEWNLTLYQNCYGP